jgi:hypothetical protein
MGHQDPCLVRAEDLLELEIETVPGAFITAILVLPYVGGNDASEGAGRG